MVKTQEPGSSGANCFVSLPGKITSKDCHDNDVFIPPIKVFVQCTWNKSVEQEKQFDTHFVEVGVMTSGSVAIKTNESKW